MIISYSRDFIFVHVHKTAGDSITSALVPILARSDIVLRNDWPPWFHKLRALRTVPEFDQLRKHSPASAVARVVPADVWARSFTFAFVRHPIGRTVSLYNYAVQKLEERRQLRPRNAWYLTPPGHWNDPLRWRAIRALLDTGTFSGFIRHPLLERDASMAAQWYLLCDRGGRLLVDFVGRYETLQEDFNVVQDRIGVPKTILGWRNASSTSCERREIEISAADRSYLAEKFAPDFVYFTYDPLTNE